MGERSVTPGRGSGLGSSAGDNHRTEAIEEETLNVVLGIDDDPPWAANLSFPDMMGLARTIKRDLN